MGYARDLFVDTQVADFHDRYRAEGPPRVAWLGVSVTKCPFDLWIYQELITRYRPDVVIEGGTCAGGSALFMASVMEMLGHGQVLTMDWDASDERPKHPRITYVTGNTLDPAVAEFVGMEVQQAKRRILVLDDGHSHDHVYQELKLFGPLLRAGDLLVVEDTNLGGPWWGLERWLSEQPEGRWQPIPDAERLLLTFNPKGYWVWQDG